MLDRANANADRELQQFMRFNSEINRRDQEIARLYTDRLFDRTVKEVPNMVCSRQIVAPVGPIVNPMRYEMVPPRYYPPYRPLHFDHDRDRDRPDRDRPDRDRFAVASFWQ
jgi:hypothetical protein